MVPKSNNKEKNWLQRIIGCIWEEFIYGGHLIASGPAIIAYIVIRLNNLAISWQVILGIYLITYLVHLLDRYIDIKNDSSIVRSSYYNKREKIIPFLISATVLLLIAILFDKPFVFLFAIFLLTAGYLYTILFKNLTRYILGFKSYYTAGIFASTVLFTAFYYNLSISYSIVALYLYFFLRWFSNTIFCDIKDINEDSEARLKTFATSFSGDGLYRFFIIIDIFSIFPIAFAVFNGYLPQYAILLLIAPFYNLYYLYLSTKEKADYQYMANVWADGESVVWLLAVVIGGYLWVS